MENKIICIAREFGSGGHEIALRTGSRLGIRVYEKDLFHLACRYGELSEKMMESADERATNPFLYRTVHEGNYHVTRGRCADYVLREEKVKLLRAFVRAPLEKRIERKMQQENLTREKAVRLVRKMDKRRKKYYESYTGLAWGSPDGYDLCIDTGTTEFEAAVNQICLAYQSL